MKKLLLSLLVVTISISTGLSQTTLKAGDIAIFGVNTDTPKNFGFVLLVDIDAGTVIRFTDSGWKADNTFRGNEGAVKYTAPTALSAGTEINWVTNAANFAPDNDATVGNNNFVLSTSGDQVLAFQGASDSPIFIYAVQTNSNVWQSDATSSTNSALPLGLVNGETAVAVGATVTTEFDNAAYDKSLMSGTKSELLEAISNNANWVGDNANPYDLTTFSFTFENGIAGLWRASAPLSAWSSLLVWDDGNVPTSSTDVVIPQGASNYPTLNAAGNCNNITLQSNANGNATILGDSYLTVSGTATVQRYFVGYAGADNGWHNISSPVNNMAIAGSDFEPGTTDDLYQWDEPSNTWENYKQNHFTNFTNGKGYLCAFENTGVKDFVGTLNTTDFTVAGLTKSDKGFNLLGNPYASALVWNNGNWVLDNVGAVAQIWEETNASYTTIAANGIIPSTNGFFVEVASAAGGSVTIPASARTHDATNNYKNTGAENLQETLDLKVTNDANSFYDITRIGFKDDATEAWDIQYDAHKLLGGEGTSQLWSVVNDENFVFNYLPYVYASYQLPIYFRAGVNATHHITAEGIGSFFANSEIYLEDLQTQEYINLVEQQEYSFEATTDDAENRFIIHFFGVTSVDNPIVEAKAAHVYAVGQTVYIRFNELPESNAQVEVFNTIGQRVYTGQLGPQNLSSIQLNEKPGIYIVRLRPENGVLTQKIIIN